MKTEAKSADRFTQNSKQKGIIITGGTRGLGAGLVKAFAEAGFFVVYTGRSVQSLEKAQAALREDLSLRCKGLVCQADDRETLEALWQEAAKHARVEAVICNAGLSFPKNALHLHSAQEVQETLACNLGGPLAAAAVFWPHFTEQGGGYFYVMEGLGSRGEKQKSTALYGASKYALAYISECLKAEAKDAGISLGALSPGMVITDLLLADYGGLAGKEKLSSGSKKIYNILADTVETVSPWLAKQVIRDMAKAKRPGTLKRFAWLSGPKIFYRFLSSGLRPRNIL